MKIEKIPIKADINDCGSCFMTLDPSPMDFESEVGRLKAQVTAGKIPPPSSIARNPYNDKIMLSWTTVAWDPNDGAGPEGLWWRVQCAIWLGLNRLGFKPTDEGDVPPEEWMDVETGEPVYLLSHLGEFFGADKLEYYAQEKLWGTR
jgi:hypothetical protein